MLVTLVAAVTAWLNAAGANVAPAPLLVLMGLSLLGFVSANRSLHGVLAVVQLTIVVAGLALPIVTGG